MFVVVFRKPNGRRLCCGLVGGLAFIVTALSARPALAQVLYMAGRQAGDLTERVLRVNIDNGVITTTYQEPETTYRLSLAGLDPVDDWLYFTSDASLAYDVPIMLRRLKIDGSAAIETPAALAVAPANAERSHVFAIDSSAQAAYWYEMQIEPTIFSVRRTAFPSSVTDDLFSLGGELIAGSLQFDEQTGTVFFAKRGTTATSFWHFGVGDVQPTLMFSVEDEAGAVALGSGFAASPSTGKVYWPVLAPAGGGPAFAIRRANMDGTAVEQVIRCKDLLPCDAECQASQEIQCIDGFSLDPTNSAIYLIALLNTADDHQIWQTDMDGAAATPVAMLPSDEFSAHKSGLTVDPRRDRDDDHVPDREDNCPLMANLDQWDGDRDRRGDACDNCPAAYNPDQADVNEDGLGDACDDDTDLDGVPDVMDQCSATPPGTAVDNFGRPLGDVDGNCRTDLADYLLFQQGFTGTDP